MEKYAFVSRKNNVAIVNTASVDNIDPRRVPSSKSTGTLRYISNDANLGMVGYIIIVYGCGSRAYLFGAL